MTTIKECYELAEKYNLVFESRNPQYVEAVTSTYIGFFRTSPDETNSTVFIDVSRKAKYPFVLTEFSDENCNLARKKNRFATLPEALN